MPKINDNKSFADKASFVHQNKYSYEKVIYVSCRKKIEIICYKHGPFFQTPDAHLYNKQGCPACGQTKAKTLTTKTTSAFITQANVIHGGIFDYNNTFYIRNCDKVIITCAIHGDFSQTPTDHLAGYGCAKCANDKRKELLTKTLNQFIADAKNIHKNKYDYSMTVYNGVFKKINIICDIHGVFKQTPHDHLSGSGCKICNNKLSRIENEWLDSLGIKNRQISIKINNHNFYLDGYDPKTNTVYEFYDDYWHGNPQIYNKNDINPSSKKTFGELYQKTINRESVIKNNGFKLITIWEKDFRANNV